jgi:tetratricopeptide (TPR) repeat protein
MTQLATQHPSLKCGSVRYEVTRTDSPDATMELMMDNAFEAARTSEGSCDLTDRRRAQWAALFKAVLPKGGDLVDLIASLWRDPQKHTREQFLERLRLISKRMGPEGRALFVVDPEKLMCSGCADSWRLVTRELPDKIKFLFAQRPEDELINSSSFMALDNVVRLPAEVLGVLATEEVDDLVRLRADEVGQPPLALQTALNRYEGHPYAIQAALEIVKETRRIEDLPQDPTNEGIAATQWQQVCRTADAIRLFEAYAILEVAVPRDTVQAVSSLDAPTIKQLLSEPYLSGLLREEGQGQRIYHSILADHVRGQIGQAEQQALHTQAVLVYRTSLREAREQHKAPDALAAIRLPEHVLAAEGPNSFVTAFIDECTGPVMNLGLFDVAIGLSERCRRLVARGTSNEAVLLNNRALILKVRGDLDGAMTLHKEAEQIFRQLGNLNGLQGSLGNQALILKDRGDLDAAMALLKAQERICRESGNLDGMRHTLGNQALILKARGDLAGAMTLHKEQERICRQLGKLDGLSKSLSGQAVILRARGDLDAAMALHREQEQICRQLGDLDGLGESLGGQALVLKDRGDLDGAMALLKEQEQVCRRLGDLDGLSRTLGNQAGILQRRGNLDEAMALLNEGERICRRMGNLEGLTITLADQAVVLYQMGRACEALPLAERAHRLATEHGYSSFIRQIDLILNDVRKAGEGT